MRTVFRILLAPIWLLLAILKLVFKIAAGAAAFVLAITGGTVAHLRPVSADHRSWLKGAYAPTVDHRRPADRHPAPCGGNDRLTGSGAGTHQRIH